MVFLSKYLGERTCILQMKSPFLFGGCIIRLADWTCFFSFIGSADWDKGLPHR
ncbi:Uncharacterised protein [Parabacteroides distasonis]|nr:Uncharacterised protein [Parabacteroides distasonis]